ncbi:hypothetical protein C8T65DRAFT_739243 [Cerioporus squamosus]|nr:hypothetical protein C8T65DRAFT_739243 [Cerioporus squamosus]
MSLAMINRALLAFWYKSQKREPNDILLDAVFTITHLTCGPQQIAIARDSLSPHLQFLIVLKEVVSPPQRTAVEAVFALLARISPGLHGDTDKSEVELLRHGYRICGHNVDEIVKYYASRLRQAKEKITEVLKADEEENQDVYEGEDADILTKTQRAIKSLLGYVATANTEARVALIPQLHANLTEVVTIIKDPEPTKLLDDIAGRGTSVALSHVSLLSRALEDLMQAESTAPGNQAEPVSVTFDELSYQELRSFCPALNEVSLDELITRIVAKLKCGHAFYTGCVDQGIVCDISNGLATFQIQATTHPEATLISYLVERNIESTSYNACSQSTCYPCHLLVETMNGVEGSTKFRLGRYNGVIDCNWKFPSSVSQADDWEKAMVRNSNVILCDTIDKYEKQSLKRK